MAPSSSLMLSRPTVGFLQDLSHPHLGNRWLTSFPPPMQSSSLPLITPQNSGGLLIGNSFLAGSATVVVLLPLLQTLSAGSAPGPVAAPQKFLMAVTVLPVW